MNRRRLAPILMLALMPVPLGFAEPDTEAKTNLVEYSHLRAVPPYFEGTCPAIVRFTGNISVRRAATVEYKYVGSDGIESPVWKLEFREPGSLATTEWSRTFEEPERGKRHFAAKRDRAKAADHFGTERLVIVSPKDESASAKVEYAVYCERKQNVLKTVR